MEVQVRLTNWAIEDHINRIASAAFGPDWRRDATRRSGQFSAGVNFQFLLEAEITHGDGRRETVGFAIVQPLARTVGKRHHYLSSTTAELTYLAVDEGARGRGVGSALLAGAEHQAATDGYGHMVVGCRPSEVGLFKRAGYELGQPGDRWVWLERVMEPVDGAPTIEEALSQWSFDPTGPYTVVGRKELSADSTIAASGRADQKGEAEQALTDRLRTSPPMNWRTRPSVHF